MEDFGALTIVWSGALLLLLAVVWLSRRARRHGGAYRAGVVGALFEWQNKDKQRALEVIVEGRAAATDPETADGNLPELEAPPKGGGAPEEKSVPSGEGSRRVH